MKTNQTYQEITKVSIHDSLQIWQDTRRKVSTYKETTLARIRSLFISDQAKCQKSIMCECDRRRCIGKTYTINYYVRKVMNYEQY